MSAVKRVAQSALKQVGLYDRIKASVIYDAYWLLADRRILESRSAEVDFYRRVLAGFRAGDLVFDIGANQGYKTDIFLRLGARVVAVEPDRHSQQTLSRRFVARRWRKPPVTIVAKAVSDSDGTSELWLDEPGSAKNTLSPKWVSILQNDDRRFGSRLGFQDRQRIQTVCLTTLIAQYGTPFYVKIDVEGHEPAVVRGLKQPIPYVSFEVNLPEFRGEGEECVQLLAKLAPEGRFNYTARCQDGLVLTAWERCVDFLQTLHECTEASIEVYWQTANGAAECRQR